MHAAAAAVATTTSFQIAGRTAVIAVSTSSRDTCLSRWFKVVTGLTPSIPLRSWKQSSCWVTESRDFRKYPKNSIFVETGSWSLSLCARPASSPTYSQNLFMPTQTHTGDIWSASCSLRTTVLVQQVECFPLVIWHWYYFFSSLTLVLTFLFFYFPTTETLVGNFFQPNLKGIWKAPVLPSEMRRFNRTLWGKHSYYSLGAAPTRVLKV